MRLLSSPRGWGAPVLLQLGLLLLLLLVPQVIQLSYLLDVFIVTALYVGLALSYDLIVGHVGSLSLAQPAFYGIGAYAVALLSTRAGWPAMACLVAAAIIAGLFALPVGIPSFRLSQYSFAIGTLGFATVAQLVAQNYIDLTDGPMCVTGVPKASIGGLSFATLPSFYYLILAVVMIAPTTTSRKFTWMPGRCEICPVTPMWIPLPPFAEYAKPEPSQPIV